MSYVTLTEMKRHMGISVPDDDDFIEDLIDQAQALIEAPWPIGIGRTFEVATATTRTFDTERDVDGRRLYLDEDLCGITSITNGDGDALTTAQYVTEPRNDAPYWAITIRSDADVAWEPASGTGNYENAITVNGHWGYSTAPSATVKYATKELVAWMYRRIRHGTNDEDRPLLTGDGSVLMPSVLPQHIKDLLRSYQKVGIS